MAEPETTSQERSGPALPPFGDVLVPVDGSGRFYETFETVSPVLACCNASLHAVHVIPPGAIARDRIRYDPEEAARETIEEMDEFLTEQGFEVESSVAHGIPEEEIVRTAKEIDTDLIVMTSAGGGILTPSVTRVVIQEVDVPVMALSP